MYRPEGVHRSRLYLFKIHVLFVVHAYDRKKVAADDKMLLAAAVVSAASYLVDQSRTDRVCYTLLH